MRQQHIHINDTKPRDIDYKMHVTAHCVCVCVCVCERIGLQLSFGIVT
jgi:hypothetical protein